MADERPRFGEMPARGSLNELHLTLVEIVSEEVAEVAADENNSALADVADALLCRSSVPTNRNLYAWIENQLPPRLHPELLRLARRINWPFLPPQSETALPPKGADPVPSGELLASEKSAAEWGAMKAIILDEWKPRLEEAGSRYKRHCDAIGVTMTIGGLKWDEAVQQAADAIGWTIDKFQVEMNLEMKRRRIEFIRSCDEEFIRS